MVTGPQRGGHLHIGMAPRTASRAGRGSGRRVTGKVLGVHRTPHAFATFLSHMKAHSHKDRKQRLSKKTTVMRMDLMSQRWRSLPAHEKEEFVAKSLAALQNKRGRQGKLLLAHRRGTPAQAAASAVAEQPPLALPPQTATAADGASLLWLSLPVPATSPMLGIGHADSVDLDDPAAPAHEGPVIWDWTERPSGIVHSLRAEVQPVGGGSYGLCLRVKDALTGEGFCLKVPRASQEGGPESARLQREYRVLGKLDHCNVVRGIAWIESRQGGSYGFLMPLAAGNLWQLLEGGCEFWQPLTRGDGVSVLVQVARGLCHVHTAGLVHLDMKPDNVLTDFVSGHHVARVADFGQSVPGPTAATRHERLVASDTVNSAGYRPLHLLYAGTTRVSVQYSFDVWAFGCVVFDVLQTHPRWRSPEGRALRLFSGTSRSLEYAHILRLRNHRISKMLETQAVALVLRCHSVKGQQGTRLSEGRMSGDLIRAIMQLEA